MLINKKKFDLRQWVLVACWDPLDVYVFDTAYLRLCSVDFSLTDLHNVYKHLSNYSIQKHTEYTENPNVMSISEFQQYLGDPTAWDSTIFPRIKNVIYRTLKGVQDT